MHLKQEFRQISREDRIIFRLETGGLSALDESGLTPIYPITRLLNDLSLGLMIEFLPLYSDISNH